MSSFCLLVPSVLSDKSVVSHIVVLLDVMSSFSLVLLKTSFVTGFKNLTMIYLDVALFTFIPLGNYPNMPMLVYN